MAIEAPERNASRTLDDGLSDGMMAAEQDSALSMLERIAVEAYGIFESRGREDGRALEDWLEAERRLREQTNELRG